MFKSTLMYFYNDGYSSASGGNANVPPAQELNRDALLPFETSFHGQSDAKETENYVAKGENVSPVGSGKTVFIDAALEDVALASQMGNVLQANQISHFPLIDFSSGPTTISKSLEQNLQECDVVILINDRVPQTWVNDRLRYYSRTFIRRRQPIEKVIIYRPTRDKRSFKDLVLPDKTKIEECSSQHECLTLLFKH